MKWCNHIFWNTDICPAVFPKGTWITRCEVRGFQGGWYAVPRTWRVCPRCEAERPTKTNRKAAELRAAMDDDQ